MSFNKHVKTAAAGIALLAAIFANGVNASTLSHDVDGFRTNPLCDEYQLLKEGLQEDSQTPTGIKASNGLWDMEIYQDKNGRWALLAKNKNATSEFDEGCILMSGKQPYEEQIWFSRYFKSDIPQAGKDIESGKNLP